MNAEGARRGRFLNLIDAYLEKQGYATFAFVSRAEPGREGGSNLFPTARQVDLGSELEGCPPGEPAIVFPPFSRWGSPGLEYHLDKLLRWASRRDQLIVIAPKSELRLGSVRHSFLARLSGEWIPEAIITGMLDMPGTRSSIELCMVALAPRREDAPSLGACRFFVTPSVDHGSGQSMELGEFAVMADFKRLLDLRGGATEWGFVARDAFDTDWRVSAHDPRLRARREDLASLGASVPVNELFELHRSFLPRGELRRPGMQVSRGPMLTGRDVALGTLDPDPRRAANKERAAVVLQGGDLLVSEIGRVDGAMSALVVDEEHVGVLAGPGIVVLRPREPLSRLEQDFFVAYLRSNRAASVRDADNTVAGRSRLSSNLLVPVPDDDILETFESLASARESFQKWSSEVDGLMKAVFDDAIPMSDVRARLFNRGRTLRQASEAARAASGLDYQIREFYPYPVGYTWRQVRTHVREEVWSDCHRSVRDAFEALVATAGSIALAACDQLGVPLSSSKAYYQKLGKNGGVSIGDWVNILKEAASLKVDVEPDSALGIVRRVLPQVGEVADAQVRLSEMRNDDAHGRLDPTQVREVAEAGVADLFTMLDNCRVLADLRLVFVSQNRWDSREKCGVADLHLLRGDHPIYSTETVDHRVSDMEKGSLYVIDPLGNWVLMRPWLVHRQCEECGRRSIYRPDHRGKEGLHIKALDHAHHMHDPEVERALAAIAGARA